MKTINRFTSRILCFEINCVKDTYRPTMYDGAHFICANFILMSRQLMADIFFSITDWCCCCFFFLSSCSFLVTSFDAYKIGFVKKSNWYRWTDWKRLHVCVCVCVYNILLFFTLPHMCCRGKQSFHFSSFFLFFVVILLLSISLLIFHRCRNWNSSFCWHGMMGDGDGGGGGGG